MSIPSLYEWAGGIVALRSLTKRFHERVPSDALLHPIFEHVAPDHPEHVAQFLAEVLGGPKDYSAKHGGHPEMVRHHLNKHLTNEQRKPWIACCWIQRMNSNFPMIPSFDLRWSAPLNGEVGWR